MERAWSRNWPEGVPRTIDYPKSSVAGLLSKAARESPDAIATQFYGARLTYREIDEAAGRLAGGLRKIGVKAGDRVSLLMPNCPQFVIAFFGVLRAGGIVVQTNPLYTPRELEEMYRDAGVETVIAVDLFFKNVSKVKPVTGIQRVVVTDIKEYLPGLLAALYPIKKKKDHGKIVIPEEPWVHKFQDLIASEPLAEEPGDLNDVAVLQYTGGTTGTPKGAMLTHRNLVVNATQLIAWMPGLKNAQERFLCAIPFFHVYGLTVALLGPITIAATMIIHPNPREIEPIMKLITKTKPAIFPGVPTMYVAIVNHPRVSRYDLKSIRACVSGAAPLPPEVRRRFEAMTGGKLVEGYGLTEASPVTHCNPIFGEYREGIGMPLPDTDAKLVDVETGSREVGVGESGELAIHGPQVMKGYWNRPEETARVITRDGWLLTGDVAVMDADGRFKIVDRKKDMIIASGYNVYPREVEDVLFEHPAVKQAAVIGIPDAYRGESVKAFVVLKDGATATDAEIVAFCKERLAPFKVPKKVEFVTELPMTLVGKVLRRALREKESARPAA
ncbi:MAG TPA: long-chain fatty acid--CoA ligase [Thermoplasmata archaeon]|nr:long-chain fatty acid--CoA ligase [Thermoplasmata archaeon]